MLSAPVMAQELRFFSAFCKNAATGATLRVESYVSQRDRGMFVMNSRLVSSIYQQVQTSVFDASGGDISFKENAYRFATTERYLNVVLETQKEGTLMTYAYNGQKADFFFNKNECKFFDGVDQEFTH